MITASEALIEAFTTAVIAFVQLVLLHFHIKLPATVQALLDESLAGKGAASGAVPSSAQGGGGAPRQTCLPWLDTSAIAAQKQTVQELPDSAETATWWNDCGETCCSMVIEAVHGVYVPPDVLRVAVLGQRSNGLTTPGNLVTMLHGNRVNAVQRYALNNAAIDVLAQATRDGRPVIALGKWPTPGGVLHWLLVTGVSGGDVQYINPWGGIHSWLSFEDWHLYATGQYVMVSSHLHFEEELPF